MLSLDAGPGIQRQKQRNMAQVRAQIKERGYHEEQDITRSRTGSREGEISQINSKWQTVRYKLPQNYVLPVPVQTTQHCTALRGSGGGPALQALYNAGFSLNFPFSWGSSGNNSIQVRRTEITRNEYYPSSAGLMSMEPYFPGKKFQTVNHGWWCRIRGKLQHYFRTATFQLLIWCYNETVGIISKVNQSDRSWLFCPHKHSCMISQEPWKLQLRTE